MLRIIQLQLLKTRLLDIYKERELLYRQYADLILDETGRDLENTLAELIRQLHITGHK